MVIYIQERKKQNKKLDSFCYFNNLLNFLQTSLFLFYNPTPLNFVHEAIPNKIASTLSCTICTIHFQ